MSSSYYGVLFAEFWDGETGQALQARGGKDACVVGTFVLSNRLANMIGLYRLRIAEIVAHTPLRKADVVRALHVLAEVGFADYDFESEIIWVREMARFRVGIRDRSGSLDARDKRVDAANRLYAQAQPNPFLPAFYDRYAKSLHIKQKREFTRARAGRGLGGPCKPGTESGSGSGIRDQKAVRNRKQGSGSGSAIRKNTGAARRPARALAHHVTPPALGITSHAEAAPAVGLVVSATLPDCAGTTAAGSGPGRRRVEGSRQSAARPIGFPVSVAARTDGGAGCSGAGVREGGPTPADTPTPAAADGRASGGPDAGGGHAAVGDAARAGGATLDGHARARVDDARRDAGTSECAGGACGADPGVACDAPSAAAVDPHGEGLATLRAAFARVRALPPLPRRRRGDA